MALSNRSLERFSNWDFLSLNYFSSDSQLESIGGFCVCKLGRGAGGLKEGDGVSGPQLPHVCFTKYNWFILE